MHSAIACVQTNEEFWEEHAGDHSALLFDSDDDWAASDGDGDDDVNGSADPGSSNPVVGSSDTDAFLAAASSNGAVNGGSAGASPAAHQRRRVRWQGSARTRHVVIQMCLSQHARPSDPAWRAHSSVGDVYRHFIDLPTRECLAVRPTASGIVYATPSSGILYAMPCTCDGASKQTCCKRMVATFLCCVTVGVAYQAWWESEPLTMRLLWCGHT